MTWNSRFQKLASLKPNKRLVIITILSIFAVGIISLLILGLVAPTIVSSNPKNQENNVSLNSSLTINFSHPYSRRDLNPIISPETEGSWSYGSQRLIRHFASQLQFTPDETLKPNTVYTVTLNNLRSSSGWGRARSTTLKFTTQNIPNVIVASVSTESSRVDPSLPITVSLDNPNDNLVDLNFRLEPETELTAKLAEDKLSYQLTPMAPLAQGSSYTLIIDRQIILYSKTVERVVSRTDKEVVYTQAFTTKPPAEITSYSPTGSSVLPSTKEISIVFSEAMDKDSIAKNISIEPNIIGSWRWQDEKTLNYQLGTALVIDTGYTVKINAGTKSLLGSSFEKDTLLKFSTVGHIRILRTTPTNNTTGNTIGSKISLTFDQPINEASFNEHFSLTPATAGIKPAWSGNTVTLNSSGLDYYTDYLITISSGLKSLYGLDLSKDYQLKFTTEEKTVVLNVKNDKQDYALSCEIAALKMALVYKGATVSENDIFNWIPFDTTAHTNDVWGDPYTGFVGDRSGSQNTTGYGVYWGPVAAAGNHYRETQAFTGWKLSDLAREIEAGNPIVVWGTLGKAYPETWYTSAGKKIDAWKGEHARTVVGYRGSVSNPSAIILNDPYYGSRITMTASAFASNWSAFNNAGILVK